MSVARELAVSGDPDRLYWHEHVREGIEAREQRDGAQWKLGDLAATVETTYGSRDLEKYAQEIGVALPTLRRYRDVARAYESAIRIADLSWTHHLVAAAHPERDSLLQQAQHEGWTVERLRVEARGPDDDLHDAIKNFDGWFHQHHIVSNDEKLAMINSVCERLRIVPLIEDMRSTRSTIPYVWAGYLLTEKDDPASVGGSLVYHPGWADYCRHLLGERTTITDLTIMPATEVAA